MDNPEWKYDKVVEIVDGLNVADFVDKDIHLRLQELAEEEVEQERAYGMGDSDEEQALDGEKRELVARIKSATHTTS